MVAHMYTTVEERKCDVKHDDVTGTTTYATSWQVRVWCWTPPPQVRVHGDGADQALQAAESRRGSVTTSDTTTGSTSGTTSANTSGTTSASTSGTTCDKNKPKVKL